MRKKKLNLRIGGKKSRWIVCSLNQPQSETKCSQQFDGLCVKRAPVAPYKFYNTGEHFPCLFVHLFWRQSRRQQDYLAPGAARAMLEEMSAGVDAAVWPPDSTLTLEEMSAN